MTIRTTSKFFCIKTYRISCTSITTFIKARAVPLSTTMGNYIAHHPSAFQLLIDEKCKHVDINYDPLYATISVDAAYHSGFRTLGHADPYPILLWLHQMYDQEEYFMHPDSLALEFSSLK